MQQVPHAGVGASAGMQQVQGIGAGAGNGLCGGCMCSYSSSLDDHESII